MAFRSSSSSAAGGFLSVTPVVCEGPIALLAMGPFVPFVRDLRDEGDSASISVATARARVFRERLMLLITTTTLQLAQACWFSAWNNNTWWFSVRNNTIITCSCARVLKTIPFHDRDLHSSDNNSDPSSRSAPGASVNHALSTSPGGADSPTASTTKLINNNNSGKLLGIAEPARPNLPMGDIMVDIGNENNVNAVGCVRTSSYF